jgi:hypothetical protein
MAIYINGITVLADGVVEPVSLPDAKDWMKIDYNDEDGLIKDLISASRVHLEKISGVALVNKLLKVNLQTTGIAPGVWMIDLPYSPLLCVDSVAIKTGINTYTTLVKNEDYEVIGGKLWLYSQGIFNVQYQCGYGSIPEDLANDILALTSWQFENRGKKMNADKSSLLSQYPNWDGLNYHQYKKVFIV